MHYWNTCTVIGFTVMCPELAFSLFSLRSLYRLPGFEHMYWFWVWCYAFRIGVTVDVIYYQAYAVICESSAAPCIIQANTFGSIAPKLAHLTSPRSCPALIELRLGKLLALWFEWVVYTPIYLLLGRDRATARHTDICGALVARLYQ